MSFSNRGKRAIAVLWDFNRATETPPPLPPPLLDRWKSAGESANDPLSRPRKSL